MPGIFGHHPLIARGIEPLISTSTVCDFKCFSTNAWVDQVRPSLSFEFHGGAQTHTNHAKQYIQSFQISVINTKQKILRQSAELLKRVGALLSYYTKPTMPVLQNQQRIQMSKY